MSLYVISILISCGLIGAVSAAIGMYAVLQKKSLLADSISHSLLPGIMLGFLIFKEKDPISISIGATVFGLISAYATDWLVNNTKIKQDTAIGINLSFFFGLGVVLLTFIQSGKYGSQSGLNQYLLGNAASMQISDIYFFTGIGVLIAAVLFLLGKEINLISFNREYAQSIGLPVKSLEFVLRLLTVLTIVAGIQAVGVVLMASCLIAPTIAAQYWSIQLNKIQLYSVITGCLSGILGALFSYYFNHVPTGPLIVIILSLAAFLSLLLGKEKGILKRILKTRRANLNIHGEHVLKSLYYINERENKSNIFLLNEINSSVGLSPSLVKKSIKHLEKKGLVTINNQDITITETGKKEANRIVRLHRLWELYLMKRLEIPADHVHENAEQIEHVLNPEIEKALLQDLDYPNRDPHNSPIPNG